MSERKAPVLQSNLNPLNKCSRNRRLSCLGGGGFLYRSLSKEQVDIAGARRQGFGQSPCGLPEVCLT